MCVDISCFICGLRGAAFSTSHFLYIKCILVQIVVHQLLLRMTHDQRSSSAVGIEGAANMMQQYHQPIRKRRRPEADKENGSDPAPRWKMLKKLEASIVLLHPTFRILIRFFDT
jgi:hypothetical protein